MTVNKKIIYHGFADQHRYHIIDYLYKNHLWEPVFIGGVDIETVQAHITSKYKDCILKDMMHLRQGRFDYSGLGKIYPIDEEIINTLSPYSMNYLGFLQDTTGWNYSFLERKQFYYDMLRYWNTVIKNLCPDLIVFSTRPHTPSCHALYLICKHYHCIDIKFLDPVPFFDKSYHIVGSSLEMLYLPFIKLYESDEDIKPGKDVIDYLINVRSKKGKSPAHILNVIIKDKKVFKLLVKYSLKMLGSTLIRGTGFRKAPQDWKKNLQPYNSMKSRMSNFEYILFRLRLKSKNKKLKKVYVAQCENPNLVTNYIYFASPYQPEAVSSINGGAYEELLLVLDILSKSIPPGWIIYYKEHFATFLQDRKGSLVKNKHYYERLTSYGNIQFVSPDFDTFSLIDNSQAVATVSGTVAWEAALRGKPALSFGSAWYTGCKSIFTINTLNDAKEKLALVELGYRPNQADLERYATAIEKIATKGMIHRDFAREMGKLDDPLPELHRIADALHKATT